MEFLHLLARQRTSARLLVVATVRSEEGTVVLRTLEGQATRVELGPLGADDVAALATAFGRPDLGQLLLERSGGHPLFVVESLRSLTAGQDGLPETLKASVEARVQRAVPEDEEVIRAASVLGPVIEPRLLARLMRSVELDVVQRCERLADSRLLVRSGVQYAFVNDLVQEAVYQGTSEPLRATYHRAAVDLLAHQPEDQWVTGRPSATGQVQQRTGWSRASGRPPPLPSPMPTTCWAGA